MRAIAHLSGISHSPVACGTRRILVSELDRSTLISANVQVERATKQLDNMREKFLCAHLTSLGSLLTASIRPLKDAGTHISTSGELSAALECTVSDRHDVPLPKVPQGALSPSAAMLMLFDLGFVPFSPPVLPSSCCL
jgi:hypothetical protein